MSPKQQPPQELLASFLDRLIDAGSESAAYHKGYSVQQMVDAVRADLEELLNTRQSRLILDTPYQEVKRSIVFYGLPDLNSIPGITAGATDSIGAILEEQIQLFEPRMRKVRVHIRDDSKEDRKVRFQIEGLLCVDPAPEIGFETVVELSTGQTSISNSTTP